MSWCDTEYSLFLIDSTHLFSNCYLTWYKTCYLHVFDSTHLFSNCYLTWYKTCYLHVFESTPFLALFFITLYNVFFCMKALLFWACVATLDKAVESTPNLKHLYSHLIRLLKAFPILSTYTHTWYSILYSKALMFY